MAERKDGQSYEPPQLPDGKVLGNATRALSDVCSKSPGEKFFDATGRMIGDESMSRLQKTRIYSKRGCPGNEKFAKTTAHSFPARPERNGRCLVFTLVRECWIAC
jgi:hypothetical protein